MRVHIAQTSFEREVKIVAACIFVFYAVNQSLVY